MAPILYLSYDGLTDPLGRSQILPYLTGLARRGYRIHLLTSEKPDRFRRDRGAVEASCSEAGIAWHPLLYHKRPPVLSSVYDLAQMRRAATRLHRQHRFGLTHCRSYIPAAVGLHLKTRFGVPLLFDMRGFWPEERTEGKSWNLANPVFRMVYRYFKLLESRLLDHSDAIVTLTEVGQRELLGRPELRGEAERITVIPCCVDFAHFRLADGPARAAARRELGIGAETPVLAYLGSLGGNYMLAEMLDFFTAYRARNAGARFLFITQGRPEPIRQAASEHGIGEGELVIRAASREEVPRFLAAADTGVGFVRPSFSAKGCSPTKMGEMLAVGLPYVANDGIGDVAEIIARTGTGVAIGEFSSASYERALDQIEGLAKSPGERRESALACFDVELGIERYDRIYCRLLTEKPASSNA